ncbi:RNA-binding protein 41 [Triplophysa dalaica]|uniref:RNA-binding protein 41 n=1 Tax=Triplophysa dalaica TaxID=1582913 RepID=UPI0024E03EA7|nr:RNA-binding protein 41 [Triplophysa dalaica]XP_056586754.1 RNA-binding protein 41 [Triplophysa dalaica]XP_056586755.1 RNA-binding protein 41 [Triplophysa dalaica]
MKRVNRRVCEDEPTPEEQETEGQRQLRNLLLKQLDTDVDFDRCVAKKKCFAPAAVYKPFGQQAAGVRSLSQFQTLQEGDQELAALRDLGLTDAEIVLWRSRDLPESLWKDRGVCAAPEARNQRLQAIRDKMAAHAELLSQPQRFSSSRPLSRREMEIENAIFHGSDSSSFLTALYHQEEESQVTQQVATSTNAMDVFCKDFLNDYNKNSERPKPCTEQTDQPCPDNEHSQAHTVSDSSPCKDEHKCSESGPVLDTDNQPQSPSMTVKKMTVSQSIGTLNSTFVQGHHGPVTISGRIEDISEEEIKNNRETEEGIRNIPRFKNYQKGAPSNVLCVKNMSPRASLAQLVSLFSRFQKDDTRPILYRLLTGRLKGQAFVTFSDAESAQAAIELLNGYRMLDKPLIIEFGRKKSGKADAKIDGSSVDANNTLGPKEIQSLNEETI